MKFDDNLLFYNMPEISEMSKGLAHKINSSYRPDIVIGVLRDGFVPAFEIVQELKVPYGFIRVQRSNISFFQDSGERVIEGGVVVPGQPDYSLNGKRVLLVDDTYHSGRTLEYGKAHLESKGAKCIMTAVLNFSQSGKTQWDNRQKPDFWEFEGYSGVFPWDASRWNASRLGGGDDCIDYVIEKGTLFPELKPIIQVHFSNNRPPQVGESDLYT
ncbi:MAG: phosphoribosyltransferase [Candidatus Aenigmatarchaeota archaeon]